MQLVTPWSVNMAQLCFKQAQYASTASIAAQRSLHWHPSQTLNQHSASLHACTTAAYYFEPPGGHALLQPHTHKPLFRPAGGLPDTSGSSLLLHGLRTHKSQLHNLSGQQAESKPGIKSTVPKPSLNARDRINGYLRESLLLSYTALFDNVIFRAFELLRLDKILKWLTPHLEDGYARVTGNWYKLADGSRRSISLVNHTAFDFSIPEQYKAADFPFNTSADPRSPFSQHGPTPQSPSPSHDNSSEAKSKPAVVFDTASLYRAHMLSLCMKLVYEKQEVIADIASNSFGCQLQDYLLTSDKQTKRQRHESSAHAAGKRSKAGFVPRTLAIVLDLPRAKIVAFRGTEPTNLINMRSSGSISMTHPEGMGGVHDGFWTALMYESEEEGGPNLFERLAEALQEGDPQQDIYLTGHSLGGALAAVFAQALCARGHKELAQRVKGVYTYGGPRIGDAQFCRQLSANYPEANFRYVHGADIIPKIPPMFLLYDHFPTEIFLSSFGDLVLDADLIRRWHTTESYAYLPIQLLKTFGNLVRLRESPIRTLYRLALLLSVPGLSDHFPQDYEKLLRDQVTKVSGHKVPRIQTWSKFSRVKHIVTGV